MANFQSIAVDINCNSEGINSSHHLVPRYSPEWLLLPDLVADLAFITCSHVPRQPRPSAESRSGPTSLHVNLKCCNGPRCFHHPLATTSEQELSSTIKEQICSQGDNLSPALRKLVSQSVNRSVEQHTQLAQPTSPKAFWQPRPVRATATKTCGNANASWTSRMLSARLTALVAPLSIAYRRERRGICQSPSACFARCETTSLLCARLPGFCGVLSGASVMSPMLSHMWIPRVLICMIRVADAQPTSVRHRFYRLISTSENAHTGRDSQ